MQIKGPYQVPEPEPGDTPCSYQQKNHKFAPSQSSFETWHLQLHNLPGNPCNSQVAAIMNSIRHSM